MNEPISKIEPLINDLKSLNVGDFLESTNYKRYLVKINFDEIWRKLFNHVKSNRRYFYADFDHDYFDSIDTMILLLNTFYTSNKESFYNYIYVLLLGYTEWSQKDLYVKNIIEDLKLLSPPQDILNKIEFLGNYFSKPVPKLQIPEYISNADKLDSMIKKLDYSIQNHEYNLTITYAYSCLEGLFKAYIDKLCLKTETNKLNLLAKIVRDDIIIRFEGEKIKYPEQIINLIPTITNAISNARNSFSDSHFDQNSDRWLAEFARDCVNSIGRLILKLLR